MRTTILFTILLLAGTLAAQKPAPPQPDWSAIEKTFGLLAKPQADGVMKISLPRIDVHVTIGPTRVEPSAAVTSWMAFRAQGSGVIATGDLAVLEGELARVSSTLQEHGFEITAVHNHLAGERPPILFVHFFAQGQLQSLLDALKAALIATGTRTRPPSTTAGSAATISYDRDAIEKALGAKGNANGSVLSFAFPRSEPIKMRGIVLPPAMGTASVINFQPAFGGVAATGDFVLKDDEVAPVTSSLRDAGIAVTAIHSHMIGDSPHMTFVHFWTEGNPGQVATALKKALALTH